MRYFEKFPNILYTLDDDRKDFKSVKNLFVKIKMLKEVLENADLFYEYPMKEGDNPWVIAHKLYGDVNRYWMVMFANERIDPYYDEPLPYMAFESYLKDKYGSIANAQNTFSAYLKRTTITTDKNGLINKQEYITPISEYSYDYTTGQVVANVLPTQGNPIVTVSTDTTSIPDADGIPVSITTKVEHIYRDAYTFEDELNESKRTIKLIRPEYASAIEQEFKDLLKRP